MLKDAEDVLGYIDEVASRNEDLAYLSLHYLGANGFVRIKEIDLNPKKCNGAVKRYSIEGWGLIQFQLWLSEDGYSCDVRVNSEKRAQKWYTPAQN